MAYAADDLSRKRIERAGKVLRRKISAAEKDDPEILDAFRVAWAWRDAHIPAMRSVRRELNRHAKQISRDPLTAARPKRMASIRAKLSARSLFDIQDIAGCRAILSDIEEIENGQHLLGTKSPHDVIRVDDHIAAPRETGYRSRHLVLQYRDPLSGPTRYKIEVQLRTRAQHAWATAVEAVGLFRGEDLKHGVGSEDWLRLFQLLSSDIAEEEGSNLVAGAEAPRRERHEEIRALCLGLDAVRQLIDFRESIKIADGLDASPGSIFLLTFDRAKREVKAKPLQTFEDVGRSEVAGNAKDRNSVLVEVDAARNLKDAYPNYFMDVSELVGRLTAITERKPEARKFDLSQLLTWRKPG